MKNYVPKSAKQDHFISLKAYFVHEPSYAFGASLSLSPSLLSLFNSL